MKYNPEIFLLILVSARWIHALNSLVAPAQKFSFSKGSWCSRGSTCRRPRRMPGNPSLELALPPSSPRLRRQNRQLRSHGRRSPQRADPGLTYHPTQVPVHLKNPCFEWFQSLLFASQSRKASFFGNRFRSSFWASTKSGLVNVFVSLSFTPWNEIQMSRIGGNFCADPVKKSGSGTGLFLKARPRFSAHSSPILFKSDLSQNKSGSC